jgi:hypothetical protein
MRLTAASVAMLTLVTSACAAPLPPSPSVPPTTSLTPTATARADPSVVPTIAPPQPTLPAEAIESSASVERDGVRVSIELDRNPMPAGEPTWITMTITNTGGDAVVYVPCGEIVSVSASGVGPPWRPGRSLPDPAMTWKSYLLDHQGLTTENRYVLFFVAGETGASSGCGDVAHVTALAAGRTVRERQRWDGFAFRQLAPPPTARIELLATFEFDRGDPLAEHPPEDRHRLEVHLETWIAGLPDQFLDPAEAVDIALSDPRLTAILASRDLRNGNEGVARFDPTMGVYQIGMLESGDLPVARAHLVLVDARTGEIVGFVERDWSYELDGYS